MWLFTYLIFTALPIATHRTRHLAMPMGTGLLSERGQAIVRMLSAAVVTYTVIRQLSPGLDFARITSGTSITLGVPSWWQYAIIPVSALLLLLYQVLDALQATDERRSAMAAITLAVIAWLLIDVVEATYIRSGSPTLLLAMPLFIAAAQIMNAGGLSLRLIKLARALVGHLRGGLAQVNVVTSVLFGFDSGSSVADASLLAKMTVPEMVRNGYPAPYCCAVIASSAILPNVIPPSIAMLLFASITNVSIGKLFMAGILPGLLIAFLLMVMVYITARRNGYGRATAKPGWAQLASPLLQAVPALLLTVLIIGGMRFGVVPATEAVGVAVVYALGIGLFFYRDLTLAEVWRGLRESAIDSAMVGFLIGVAAPFAWVLITGRVPQQFLQVMLTYVNEGWVVLLCLNLIMLLAGSFLELPALMLILVPLTFPLIVQLGIDPVHFGVIVVVNLMLGGLTPPYGVLVFIPAAITGTSVGATFRAAMPFFLILVFGLALLTYVPWISLALVHAFF